MPIRDTAPKGSPTWVDLWTPDVKGSRAFYADLLGWEAAEPSAEFGGYFLFLRDDIPVAGGMGPVGDEPAQASWKPYFATDDITKTVETAQAAGATVTAPVLPIADLGVQAVLTDPAGARFGLWQAGTFPGFTVLNEPGAPSWFELHTPRYDDVLEFYGSVLGWETDVVMDGPEMRYRIVSAADRDGHVAGVLDTSGAGTSRWHVYWEVADVDATARAATSLGAALERQPEDTPYGRLASLVDPAGAPFRLRRG